MSTQGTKLSTDSDVEKQETVGKKEQGELKTDLKTVVNDDIPELVQEKNNHEQDKSNYEVVFFARYNNYPRPSVEEITKYFNKYGKVDHVNCPEGRNYAFVFISELSTPVEHRRTRTTISQIINDMTPENRFHITVASSNRGTSRDYQPYYQYKQYNPIAPSRESGRFNNTYRYPNRGIHQIERNVGSFHGDRDYNTQRNDSRRYVPRMYQTMGTKWNPGFVPYDRAHAYNSRNFIHPPSQNNYYGQNNGRFYQNRNWFPTFEQNGFRPSFNNGATRSFEQNGPRRFSNNGAPRSFGQNGYRPSFNNGVQRLSEENGFRPSSDNETRSFEQNGNRPSTDGTPRTFEQNGFRSQGDGVPRTSTNRTQRTFEQNGFRSSGNGTRPPMRGGFRPYTKNDRSNAPKDSE